MKYELISTIVRKEETNNKQEKKEQPKNRNNVREVLSYIRSSIDKDWRRAGDTIYIINNDSLFDKLNKKYIPILLI